ncbi:MAG: glycine-rich domain-containing protein [Kiritimatiellia bacterium]
MKSIGFDCKRLRSIPRALLLWILLPILLLTLTRTTSATLATGGNITNDVGGYRIHVFTNSATASNFVVTFSGNIDVLVVGGGGGGGQRVGGGGGGGGVVYATNYAVPAGTTTVIVGNGGAGATSNVTLGTNGQNSAFDLSGGAGRTITALGGRRR